MDREAMEIPRAILSRRDLTHGEKSTMTALYLYAYSGELEVFPSNQTLAELTAQTARSVQRQLSRFESIGLIERGHDGVKRVITLCPQGHPASDVSPPTSDGSPPRLSPVTPPRPTGAPLHIRNQPKNQPEKHSRPKGQPLAANNAQLSITEALAECPDEPPAKLSTREQWINSQWSQFNHLRDQLRDRLIDADAIQRRGPPFKFTKSLKRMLGKLHSEKYSREELFEAWVEMAKNAEDNRSLKYFRPSTCFVARNIDRSLEDRVNNEAKEIGEC